jgi:hypothetical protein
MKYLTLDGAVIDAEELTYGKFYFIDFAAADLRQRLFNHISDY